MVKLIGSELKSAFNNRRFSGDVSDNEFIESRVRCHQHFRTFATFQYHCHRLQRKDPWEALEGSSGIAWDAQIGVLMFLSFDLALLPSKRVAYNNCEVVDCSPNIRRARMTSMLSGAANGGGHPCTPCQAQV